MLNVGHVKSQVCSELGVLKHGMLQTWYAWTTVSLLLREAIAFGQVLRPDACCDVKFPISNERGEFVVGFSRRRPAVVSKY